MQNQNQTIEGRIAKLTSNLQLDLINSTTVQDEKQRKRMQLRVYSRLTRLTNIAQILLTKGHATC